MNAVLHTNHFSLGSLQILRYVVFCLSLSLGLYGRIDAYDLEGTNLRILALYSARTLTIEYLIELVNFILNSNGLLLILGDNYSSNHYIISYNYSDYILCNSNQKT